MPHPLPVAYYARCVDASEQPAGYVGDWPELGRVYPVRLLTHAPTGLPHVRVEGFHAESPWGDFHPSRFWLVAQIWLN